MDVEMKAMEAKAAEAMAKKEAEVAATVAQLRAESEAAAPSDQGTDAGGTSTLGGTRCIVVSGRAMCSSCRRRWIGRSGRL